MFRKIVIVVFLAPIFWHCSAQDAFKRKFDIGVNVTSMLANVISLGGNDDTPRYNLSFRIKKDRSGYRISTNISYNKDSEIGTDGVFLQLTEADYRVKLGYEKYQVLTGRFILAYGLDAIWQRTSSFSEAGNGFSNDEKFQGIGGGPAFRFEYKLSDRVSLMTETTLYFLLGRKTDELSLSGQSLNKSTNDTVQLSTQIPSVLFLNVHF
ncbi:MAG: hypothetical protein IPN29_11930 [Saprospiraceae bacterium]|nr:hypothetical protein [Saprospiraceae bacterium]